VLFTLAVFLNAFLLFQVQPIVGKMVLPQFGGSPSVWSTTMLFFQVVLLGGYAYAHGVRRILGDRKHALLHLGLLLAAAFTLPFSLRLIQQDANASPLIVIATLALTIGAPFFVISAGAPLLQRWFGESGDPRSENPYFLYAASNLGSMLALLAYPFVVEPALPLGQQSQAWSLLYAGLVLGIGFCIAKVWSKLPERPQREEPNSDAVPSRKVIAQWMLLSLAPSGLIMGTTSYVTANIAPVPLLWVLPLALYLLTFIIAFSDRFAPPTWLARYLAPLAIFPVAITIANDQTGPVLLIVPLHLGAFFLTCLACHGELAKLRPPKQELTRYFLWISIGGALGGAFCALVAPVIFKSYAEYPWMLVLACVAAGWASAEQPWNKWDFVLPSTTFVVILILRWISFYEPNLAGIRLQLDSNVWLYAAGALLMVCAIRFARFGFALGALFLAVTIFPRDYVNKILYLERTFFGILKVEVDPDGSYKRLVHGNTLHGIQPQDPQRRNRPVSYYFATSAVGRTFAVLSIEPPAPVAVVGLGAGTMAAYNRDGQSMTFYEIDPAVEKIARDPNLFTYLRDAKGKVDVVLGDARIKLKDAPNRHFGVVALDAFSSDAIPVHLLTKESFKLVQSKLRPDGLVLVHISNRYLDLSGPVAAIADEIGMVGLILDDLAIDPRDYSNGKFASSWILLANNRKSLRNLDRSDGWEPLTRKRGIRAWTDDYSNVMQLLVR
jgi:SAM-dependent methyltransferase